MTDMQPIQVKDITLKALEQGVYIDQEQTQRVHGIKALKGYYGLCTQPGSTDPDYLVHAEAVVYLADSSHFMELANLPPLPEYTIGNKFQRRKVFFPLEGITPIRIVVNGDLRHLSASLNTQVAEICQTALMGYPADGTIWELRYADGTLVDVFYSYELDITDPLILNPRPGVGG